MALEPITVSGRFRLEDPPTGFDLKNHQVIVRNDTSLLMKGSIAADGTFQVTGVPWGAYEVIPSESALHDMYVKSQSDAQEIVLSGNGGQISGSVNAGGATVVLVPSVVRFDQYKVATADASGQFEIRGIAPGEYSVYAWNDVDSGAWFDPNFLNLFRDSRTSIRITEGQRLNLALRVAN
jgi:hypothetical protein